MSSRLARTCVVLLLGACLGSTLVAQGIEPRALRATAGESRTAAWRDGGPLTAITSTHTTPLLEFPIRVEPRRGEPFTFELLAVSRCLARYSSGFFGSE